MGVVEAKLPNTPDALEQAHNLVSKFAASEQLLPEVVIDLNVVLDELLSNVIKYGYSDSEHHVIRMRLAVTGDALEIALEDDGKPFNPLLVPAPDLKRSLSERKPGGLGLHFVRNLVDEADYARVADRNRLILRKFLKR